MCDVARLEHGSHAPAFLFVPLSSSLYSNNSVAQIVDG
jgi:hypothetical protein